jgi:hypothetical protein
MDILYFLNLAAILTTTYLPSRLEKHAHCSYRRCPNEQARCTKLFAAFHLFILFCVCSTTVHSYNDDHYFMTHTDAPNIAASCLFKNAHTFASFDQVFAPIVFVQQAMFHRCIDARHLATLKHSQLYQ